MRKSLIIGLTVLSVMLFAGIGYSAEGPSEIVVFPLICEVPASSSLIWNSEHLDMVFTIANVRNLQTPVNAFVRNYKSRFEFDFVVNLSPYDVSSNSCLSVINMMPATAKADMIETINGKQYYAGYIEYDVRNPESGEAIIGWGEMKTLRTALRKLQFTEYLYTDAGFNGVPDFYTDVNAASTFSSDLNWTIVSNQILMPRYKIVNNDPATINWWIIMTPSDALTTASGSCTRVMDCIICDEDENCISKNISIPNQVNIVNVADILPGFFPTFPKVGFAMCDVVLHGTGVGELNPCGNAGNEQYVGWSYQYTRGTGDLRTALIFPVHREVKVAGPQ